MWMRKRSVAPVMLVICLLLLVGMNSLCVIVCNYSLQRPNQCGVVFVSLEMCDCWGQMLAAVGPDLTADVPCRFCPSSLLGWSRRSLECDEEGWGIDWWERRCERLELGCNFNYGGFEKWQPWAGTEREVGKCGGKGGKSVKVEQQHRTKYCSSRKGWRNEPEEH